MTKSKNQRSKQVLKRRQPNRQPNRMVNPSKRANAPVAAKTQQFTLSNQRQKIRRAGKDVVVTRVLSASENPPQEGDPLVLIPFVPEAFNSMDLIGRANNKWIPRCLSVHVSAQSSSNTSGGYILAYIQDVEDLYRAQDWLATAASTPGSMTRKYWEDCVITQRQFPKRELYTDISGDLRESSPGGFVLVATGPPTQDVTLFVEAVWDADFMDPVVNPVTEAPPPEPPGTPVMVNPSEGCSINGSDGGQTGNLTPNTSYYNYAATEPLHGKVATAEQFFGDDLPENTMLDCVQTITNAAGATTHYCKVKTKSVSDDVNPANPTEKKVIEFVDQDGAEFIARTTYNFNHGAIFYIMPEPPTPNTKAVVPYVDFRIPSVYTPSTHREKRLDKLNSLIGCKIQSDKDLRHLVRILKHSGIGSLKQLTG